MSIRQDTTKQYCSVADVSRYFDPAAEMDADDVSMHILKWTSRFDRRTGQAFRANQVFDEVHDHERLYYWLSGHPIRLQRRNLRSLDATKGDKLEVYTGNKWEDWLQKGTYEEGRDEDYWLDAPNGILFIYERAILRPHPKFRVTYRFGNSGDPSTDIDADGDDVVDYVPNDVRDAVAAAAAADLIRSDIYAQNVPGNERDSNVQPMQAAKRWDEQFERVVGDYKKVRWV